MKDKYYNQEDIWGNGIDFYQKQVLETIKNNIPKDVNTILDVGCGDGYITNPLSKMYEVTGMDISKEALKYLDCNGVVGSITDIPFPNESFDMVIINDVLEHIEDDIYDKALSELVRVTKKYILVTVPNEEDLENKTVVCKNCEHRYHINWHQREYSRKKMETLFYKFDATVQRIIYTGDICLPNYNPMAMWNHMVKDNYDWKDAICPNCETANLKNENLDKRIIYATRQNYWNEDGYLDANNRSEVMAIFKKNSAITEIYFYDENLTKETYKYNTQNIQFYNILQRTIDLTEGQKWARYQTNIGINVTEKVGVSLNPEFKNGYLSLFYTSLKKGDKLLVKGDKLNIDKIAIFAIDPILNLSIELKTKYTNKDSLCILLDEMWNSTQFGFQIDIYIYDSKIVLKEIIYEGEFVPNTDFWKIKKGFNLYSMEDDFVYNAFYSEVDGSIPLFNKMNKVNYTNFDDIYTNINKQFFKSIDILKLYEEQLIERNADLNLLLNQKEEEREHLNGLLNQKEEEREHLNGLLNQKEEEREYLNGLLNQKENEIFEKAQTIEKIKNRKINKVLVLSHMFPSEENKVNGCFVHEQVKSLRVHEDIDARVITCKPFWLNGLNFKNIIKANKVYENEIINNRWTYYDDVPALYLPYRVGMPLIPFHIHSISYTNSIMKIIDSVWKEFKFDLIHAHTAYLDGNAAKAISEKYNVPYVITEHTGPFSILTDKIIVKQKTLNSIKNSSQTWAVSDSLKDTITDFFEEEHIRNKIGVIYNGVDLNRFSLNEKSNLNDSINIMFVGYLEPVKNPLILIESFYEVNKIHTNTVLHIVGEGTLSKEVRSRVKTLNLEEKVIFYGMKSREEVAELIRDQCDIFILPSKSETFGVVLIEAMGCGKPIVSTKCGGPNSIVESDVGVLCDVDSVQSLVDGIEHVIKNLKYYNPYKIREIAENKFSCKKIASIISLEYEKI